MRTKLFNWKGVFILSLLVGIGIFVVAMLIKQPWINMIAYLTAALPNVAFNWRTLIGYAVGIYQTIRVGWKQMKINQLEKQELIQRLIKLEVLQRNNIDSYFRTHVESVSYKGLAATAPHINLEVRFFNLSIFQCKVKSWKLRFDRPDTYQMVCKGHQCQLRPQGEEVRNSKISECQCQPLHIRLDLENVVASLIREASNDKELVSYRLSIDWEVELEGVGSHTYKDELPYDNMPNLAI